MDFITPKGFWRVVATVPVFVIEPVSINTFIRFKKMPQVIQVWSCVGKCWLKGLTNIVLYLRSFQGSQSYIGLTACNFCVLQIYVVCYILMFVKNCLFL